MNQPTNSEKTQVLLHSTLRKVMRPLVRLMLSQGINYTMMLEDLKRVFVNVAKNEFKIDGKAQTNSRITLLTGVHRKDVQLILSEDSKVIGIPVSIGGQIIGLWLGNNKYHDADGKPLPLARLASKGGELSFEALVASISKDFRSRPVLDEWLRVGFVRIDDKDLVRMNIRAFAPNQNLEEKISFFSMNVHDHIAAAVNNLDSKNDAMLERCVYYDGLSHESIEILHEFAKKSGMDTISAINRLAAELKAGQTPGRRESDKSNQRMNFGVYFYHGNNDNPESASES
jgi:hypothetical protein